MGELLSIADRIAQRKWNERACEVFDIWAETGESILNPEATKAWMPRIWSDLDNKMLSIHAELGDLRFTQAYSRVEIESWNKRLWAQAVRSRATLQFEELLRVHVAALEER